MKRIEVPKDASDAVTGLLILVGDRLRRVSDQRYLTWEMTESHYNVLRILNGAGRELSQVEISRELLYSRANITKLVDHLEAKGLVRRTGCDDRRKNLVALTERGRAFLKETIDDVVRSSSAIVHPLTEKELAHLERLLTKLLKGNPALAGAR